MLTSGWITATIADEAKLSGEIDLKNHYNKVLIIMPDLDTDSSGTVQVSNASGGTFANLHDGFRATPADVTVAKSKATPVVIAGARYLKISCAHAQSGAKTIYVLGVPW